MIPSDTFIEVKPRKDHENTKRNYFLDDFQLKRCKLAVADAICGDLKTVFGECDQPAYDDYGDERRFAIFEMPIPRDRHKNVRTYEK